METLTSLLGWLGSIAFAVCGLPLAIDVIKKKSAKHIDSWFIGLWFVGEACTLCYVLIRQDYPLMLNYTFNLLTLIIVIHYKWRYEWLSSGDR